MSITDPMSRLMRRRYVDKSTGCWNFAGALTANGYGVTGIGKRTVYNHRLSYEHFIGPIPADLVIDHLCRNRACFNPEHLEPVARGENVRRGISSNSLKTHCNRGHEYSPENTYVIPKSGGRVCRTCVKQRSAA